jgi:hypothetical protein
MHRTPARPALHPHMADGAAGAGDARRVHSARCQNIEIRFYDDRTESIPFDEPTDLVAMSVETYTAKRSYQIASEFDGAAFRW